MLVHDSAVYLATFMTLETIRDSQCPDDLRGPIFDGRDVIRWHRIQDFQRVSLKLLAEQLLLGCPSMEGLTSMDRHSCAGEAGRISLYIPGELPLQRMQLRKRLVVYASAHNPGAHNVAQDLAFGMGGGLEVTSDAAALRPNGSKCAVATHLLLYLNDQTFLNEAGERLAQELRVVRAEGSTVDLVMVHENKEPRGGCNFDVLFDGRTPQDLIAGGIYNSLALALYPDQFWPVSVALVARAMGATSARRGFRTASAERSPVNSSESPINSSATLPPEDDTSNATSNSPGTALPRMGPAAVQQIPQALPRPGYGLQRMGAEQQFRHSVLEAVDSAAGKPPAVKEGERPPISYSAAEKRRPSNTQQMESESLSKSERIRIRKASIMAGDDEWGGPSKARPGRETFRDCGAGSSRDAGDLSVQQRTLWPSQQAEAGPQGRGLARHQSSEQGTPKSDANASRPRRGNARVEHENICRV